MTKENNGWISVKDALPEPHNRVYDVTHWQPLSPPPTIND